MPSLAEPSLTHKTNGRTSFTRSHSPAVVRPSVIPIPAALTQGRLSPSGLFRHRPYRAVLPASLRFSWHLPFSYALWTFCVDAREVGETLLLSASLLYITSKLSGATLGESAPDVSTTASPITRPPIKLPSIAPLIIELSSLVMATLLYSIWTHISRHTSPPPSSIPPSPAASQYSSSQVPETRDGRRYGLPNALANKPNHSYVWMSVPKNYRWDSSVSILSLMRQLH